MRIGSASHEAQYRCSTAAGKRAGKGKAREGLRTAAQVGLGPAMERGLLLLVPHEPN